MKVSLIEKLCMYICVRVVWWIGCVVVSMMLDVVSMMFSVACGEYSLMWGVPCCGVVCLMWCAKSVFWDDMVRKDVYAFVSEGVQI